MGDAVANPFFSTGIERAPKLRTIRLYGVLGARFGREFRLAIDSAAEAVRALSVQLPGFAAFLNSAKDRGMVFAVFLGKRNISESQLADPPGNFDIRIAPVMQGAKRAGVLQTIVGVILVIVGTYTSIFSAGGTSPLIGLGWSMIVGGVAQMLAPQPKGLGAKDSADNQASYNFNGAVNTQAQGNPAPVGYGRCWGGSAVISGGVYAEDQV